MPNDKLFKYLTLMKLLKQSREDVTDIDQSFGAVKGAAAAANAGWTAAVQTMQT